MKVVHHPVFDHLLLAVIASCLLFAAPAKSSADSDDHLASAENAARAWVTLIDAGQYEQSYADSCDAMQSKVPEDKWVLILKTLRTPWGSVVSRKEVSHVYKPTGVTGLEGECMIITFDTTFKNLPAGAEEIVLKWDGSKWRGAGYNAGAKPTPEDQATTPLPPAHTEVNDQTVTPPAK